LGQSPNPQSPVFILKSIPQNFKSRYNFRQIKKFNY
jgi:hypothetical protein